MAKVKGTAFASRLKYLDEKSDQLKKEYVLKLLSPALQAEIQKGILTGSWYPFDYYVELNRAMDKILGKGDLSKILEFGRFSAEHAVTGIYRIFFRLGSPEFTFKLASNVWNQYFVNGQLRSGLVGPKHIKLEMVNVEVVSREHQLSVHGWCERLLELTGAKNIKIDTKSYPSGPVSFEYHVRWE